MENEVKTGAAWFQIYDELGKPGGLMIIGEAAEPDDIDPLEFALESLANGFTLKPFEPPEAKQ